MPGEAPLKPKPQRRSDTQIPLIRLATRLILERGLGTSSWSEKHVDVRPIKLSELPARGEPVARENLSAWIITEGTILERLRGVERVVGSHLSVLGRGRLLGLPILQSQRQPVFRRQRNALSLLAA
jgi:hypothetical protein